MNKFQLVSPYSMAGQQPEAVNKLVAGLTNGELYQTLLGVTGSGKTFSIANVIEHVQRPTLVLAHNKTLAAQLYGEMKAFFPHNAVEYFVSYYDYYQPEAYVPATDTFIEKDASINEHIEQMRLSATKAIMERKDVIIVATVSAIYGLGDPKSYLDMVLHLSRGHSIAHRKLLKQLATMQYTRNDTELHRATYRVRGDVIDIFPAESEKEALRVHLFDDYIERLELFDPLTGGVFRNLARYTVFPKTHYVTPKDIIHKTIEQVQLELKNRLKHLHDNNQLLEAQRLEQRTNFDIEMMLELGYCSGIENYSRYLSGRKSGEPPPTLIEYLSSDTLLVVDESHATIPQVKGMYLGDRSRKETLVSYGFRLPSAMDNRPLQFEEFMGYDLQTIYVSATPRAFELERSSSVIDLVVRPTGLLDPSIQIRSVRNQVEDLLSEIWIRSKAKERVLVTTLTKKMSEDLSEYLADQGVKVRYLHSNIDTVERVEILRDLRLGVFDVLVGINLLREGLDLPEVSLVAILDADKEGFLRSESALIQTMGRAARNVNGMAILYADKQTGSIQRAVAEVERRRKIQIAYNKTHKITPKSISKQVADILEIGQKKASAKNEQGFVLSDTEIQTYEHMSQKELSKLLKKLEKKMYACSINLEFEQAAKIRDEIQSIEMFIFKGSI